MIALGIDTAGPVIGAALVAADGTRARWSRRVTRGADAALAPALAALIADRELDVVAVSVGPGSFTSLRVGVASALGVALGRGLPVVPISSLEARAAAVEVLVGPGPLPRVLALLDARKGRAYAALYRGGRVGDEVDLPPEQAIAMARPPFVATGEGAEVFRAQVEAAGGVVYPGAAESPAAAVARLGLHRIDSALPPEAVRLNYIRPSDARPPRR